MLCPNEQRSVAVLTRHVAFGITFEMEVFREIAAGQQPATITRAALADMNAQHARAWAECSQPETLALLRHNAAAAGDEVRRLSDEQLARAGRYDDAQPEPWTVDQWIERVLIGHVYRHLESIRAALAS